MKLARFVIVWNDVRLGEVGIGRVGMAQDNVSCSKYDVFETETRKQCWILFQTSRSLLQSLTSTYHFESELRKLPEYLTLGVEYEGIFLAQFEWSNTNEHKWCVTTDELERYIVFRKVYRDIICDGPDKTF